MATELWFREEDKDELQKKQAFTTVRSGDRTESTRDPKGGYKEGRFVDLKIQKADGTFDEWQSRIVPSEVKKIKFGEMKDEDLTGSLPGQKTKEELRVHLEKVYGRPFGDDEEVTLASFEFAENLKSAEDLLRTKVASIARGPKDNPTSLEFPAYTLPLLSDDYPAKTAVMWNAAYRQFGLSHGNIMLVANPAASLDILKVLRRDKKYLGGGAGVGFKDESVPHLDELDPLARAIEAVNIIKKTTEGELVGYNTDGRGYAEGLAEVFAKRGEDLHGKKAVIIGAGGSANAVAFALAERGMHLVIINRTVDRAKVLSERINSFYNKSGDEMVTFGGEDKISEVIKDADVVVNVSVKGAEGDLKRYSALAPAKMPLTEENVHENLAEAERNLQLVPKTAVISDIVLGREATPFLKQAESAGFETLDGIPMVINQGIEAFWLLHEEELPAKGITKEQVARVMKFAAKV